MTNLGRNKFVNTTYYSPSSSHPGLNLYAPLCGKEVLLVSMVGKLIHKWNLPFQPGCDVDLLPNCNILFAGKVENGPLSQFEGTAGVILEVDRDGNTVWEHKDPYHHHAFYRLENGNTLYLKWIKVPADTAEKVKGGQPGFGPDGVMWGDAIVEIDPTGKLVNEWIAHEHLHPELDTI